LHRSEGFGLGLAEAMALEKPVVATGYSANLEFMDESCARLVRCTEIMTDRAYGPYPRGTRWAEPDIEHAAYLLRSLAFDGDVRRDLGRRAKRRVAETLAPQVIAKTLRERLGWDDGDPSVPDDVRQSGIVARMNVPTLVPPAETQRRRSTVRGR
jgi:glycosyltransferase involved in cell wall biosynthesis